MHRVTLVVDGVDLVGSVAACSRRSVRPFHEVSPVGPRWRWCVIPVSVARAAAPAPLRRRHGRSPPAAGPRALRAGVDPLPHRGQRPRPAVVVAVPPRMHRLHPPGSASLLGPWRAARVGSGPPGRSLRAPRRRTARRWLGGRRSAEPPQKCRPPPNSRRRASVRHRPNGRRERTGGCRATSRRSKWGRGDAAAAAGSRRPTSLGRRAGSGGLGGRRDRRSTAGEQLEVLVEHVAADPRVGLLPAVVPLERSGANADAEHQPATAEPVQRDGLPGDHHRSSTWQRRDEGAQPNPARGTRRGGQRDPRVDHVDRAPGEGEEVVPKEEAVPAGGLRGPRPLGDQGRINAGPEARHRHPKAHPLIPLTMRAAPSRKGNALRSYVYAVRVGSR